MRLRSLAGALLSVLATNLVHADEYMDESLGSCNANKNLLSCAKYELLSYISNYTNRSIIIDDTGVVKLIKIDHVEEEDNVVFPTARFMTADFEVTKFYKFILRQIDYFLQHQGLQVTLPEGVRLIRDDPEYNSRGHHHGRKKKTDMLIQLVTLFKVFKIKVLVTLAVVGIFFIKKVLIAAALILPSVFQSLKMSCHGKQMVYPHHYEEHFDDFGGYGGGGGYAGNSGYGYSAEKTGLYRRQRK